jgi:hypothetical protein
MRHEAVLRDTPTVHQLFTTEAHTGYMTRVMCLVDGTPAEIHIEVNNRRPEHSTFELAVLHADSQEWKLLHRMTHDEVKGIMGSPGVLPDSPETREQIQAVVTSLHLVASAILRASREQAALLAAQTAVFVDREVADSRMERRVARRLARESSAAREAARTPEPTTEKLPVPADDPNNSMVLVDVTGLQNSEDCL